MIPYFSVAILWCIPFQLYFFDNTIVKLFKSYLLAMAPSQLWFLVMLFVLMLLFYKLSEYIEKKNKRYIYIGFFILLYGLSIVSVIIPNIFQISSALQFMLIYYLGFIFRKIDTKNFYKINPLIYFMINIIFFSIYYYLIWKQGRIIVILRLLYFPLVNISGILMVIVSVNFLSKYINVESRVYQFLKKYNFAIYLFHQQIIYCVITLFNGIVNPYGLVLLNFTIAFVLSGVMAYVLGKFKYTKLMFGIS